MCGIAAIVPRAVPAFEMLPRLQEMLVKLSHRGPDAVFTHTEQRIAMGMTRLAIVGGDSGQQPIWNETNTCAVICNGEIYNHVSLRESLERRGHTFSTQCDIEVIVHLYEDYGVDGISHLDGIFALLIWDAETGQVVMARDKVGVKPIYYASSPLGVACASELYALASWVNAFDLDPDAVRQYHSLRFTPGPSTLIRDIHKLPAAHYAIVGPREVSVHRYWSPSRNPLPIGQRFTDRANTLRQLVLDAVRDQLTVEVGTSTLLSGGLDSSLLVAIQSGLLDQPVTTITVGFEKPASSTAIQQDEYDEAAHAHRIAEEFGCRALFQTYSAEDAWTALPAIFAAIDEPIADPTAIPLWFASRLAHGLGHRVLYSGEGMDELFAGYQAYRQVYWMQAARWLGPAGCRVLQQLMTRMGHKPPSVLNHAYAPVAEWYRSIGQLFHDKELPHLLGPSWPMMRGPQGRRAAYGALTSVPAQSLLNALTEYDCKFWLPENTLVKSDKISMAHSVELRVPFLAESIYAYAHRLQARDKLRWGQHKYIVKRAFSDVLPKSVLKRRKAGFPVPLTAWMFGEWHDRIREVLLQPQAASRRLYRESYIQSLLSSPEADRRRASRLLWCLLTMEFWMQRLDRELSSSKAVPMSARISP